MRARRLAAWIPPARTVNAAVAADGNLTLRRAREIVLSTPLAANAVDAWVGNAVGTGIKPSPLVGPELKAPLQELWRRWTDEADADGVTDFYGLQALVARSSSWTLRINSPGGSSFDGVAIYNALARHSASRSRRAARRMRNSTF